MFPCDLTNMFVTCSGHVNPGEQRWVPLWVSGNPQPELALYADGTDNTGAVVLRPICISKRAERISLTGNVVSVKLGVGGFTGTWSRVLNTTGRRRRTNGTKTASERAPHKGPFLCCVMGLWMHLDTSITWKKHIEIVGNDSLFVLIAEALQELSGTKHVPLLLWNISAAFGRH